MRPSNSENRDFFYTIFGKLFNNYLYSSYKTELMTFRAVFGIRFQNDAARHFWPEHNRP